MVDDFGAHNCYTLLTVKGTEVVISSSCLVVNVCSIHDHGNEHKQVTIEALNVPDNLL